MNYYDNIADIYDQTRWLTKSVAEQVADFIIQHVGANSQTTFLEPGVGTGLNVLPLVERGYQVTGIDISEQMLNQFRQKLKVNPKNLQLIHGDAAKLPFLDNSFDVVLTVHMIHAIADWQEFLDNICRVLKPGGFYLNSQWITPPSRREFERHFCRILTKYEIPENPSNSRQIQDIQQIDVEGYFCQKGIKSNYLIAKEWEVRNTVSELINFFKLRAYGLCWRVSEDVFKNIISEFEEFCVNYYGDLDKTLSTNAKFEIWSYQQL
jgi:ubiquinone/menaquinone biosynthesis C-methylase UbiE